MAGGPWQWEVLVPAHRIVFGLLGDEVVESRAATAEGTFAAYRRLEGAVPGMIAWPNTMLLTGPETVVVDPGYQTQGDMLDGALRARGIDPAGVRTVVMTHLHSDHLSALPQLPGVTEVWVHRDELDTPWARRQRGIVDDAPVVVMDGAEGAIREGLTWFHTPGHAPGHVVFFNPEARFAIVGDVLFNGSVGRTDLPGGDHAALIRSIKEKLLPLGDNMVCLPGHGPVTSIGDEKAHNPFLR